MNLDFTLWTSMYRDKDNKAIDAIDYKLEVKYCYNDYIMAKELDVCKTTLDNYESDLWKNIANLCKQCPKEKICQFKCIKYLEKN